MIEGPTLAPEGHTGSVITIRARGNTGRERMRLALNNRYVAVFNGVDTEFTDYTFYVQQDLSMYELRLNFTNKGNLQGADKLLQVSHVEIDGVRFNAADAALTSGSIAAPGSKVCLSIGKVGTDTLRCNGSMRFQFIDSPIELRAE